MSNANWFNGRPARMLTLADITPGKHQLVDVAAASKEQRCRSKNVQLQLSHCVEEAPHVTSGPKRHLLPPFHKDPLQTGPNERRGSCRHSAASSNWNHRATFHVFPISRAALCARTVSVNIRGLGYRLISMCRGMRLTCSQISRAEAHRTCL